MTIEGLKIVSTYSQAGYTMRQRDFQARSVQGIEIVESVEGITFDFTPVYVPVPQLEGPKMQRGVARGQIIVSSEAKKKGLSEREVIDFFLGHDDYGYSLLAVDADWQPVPVEDLTANQPLVPVVLQDDPYFEDRGYVDGKRRFYDRLCDRTIVASGYQAHVNSKGHVAAKEEAEADSSLEMVAS